MQTVENLKEEMDSAKKSWNEILKQIQKLQPENAKRYELYKKSLEKYHRALLEENGSDLSLLLDNADSASNAVYKAREKFGAKIGIKFSGYYPQTGQAAPQLIIEASFDDDKLNKIIESMEMLMGHLKTVENDEWMFPILDNGLSESHHYILLIGEKIHIIDTYSFDYRYHKKSVENFDTLFDALKWIRRNAYYGEEEI